MRFGINTEFFFDRAKVTSLIDKNTARILGRTGAAGRLIMRRSIRKAPKKKKYKATPPFPRYHVANAGLRLITYAYQPQSKSVIIGPELLRDHKQTRTFRGRTVNHVTAAPVPQILNEGLRVKRITRYRGGLKVTRTLKYRKFDFADRALSKTADRMADLTQQIGLL